jgi:hypothetical protein
MPRPPIQNSWNRLVLRNLGREMAVKRNDSPDKFDPYQVLSFCSVRFEIEVPFQGECTYDVFGMALAAY